MKKLTKISLNDLGQAEMLKKEMSMIKGGSTGEPTPIGTWRCGCIIVCGCEYEGTKEGPDDDKYGGSSTADNGTANGANTTDDANQNYPIN